MSLAATWISIDFSKSLGVGKLIWGHFRVPVYNLLKHFMSPFRMWTFHFALRAPFSTGIGNRLIVAWVQIKLALLKAHTCVGMGASVYLPVRIQIQNHCWWRPIPNLARYKYIIRTTVAIGGKWFQDMLAELIILTICINMRLCCRTIACTHLLHDTVNCSLNTKIQFEAKIGKESDSGIKR